MTEVVTVNLKRCENCGVCEMACAERHGGKARLKVKDVLQSRGLIFDEEALPIVCKQCENPACIEVCKPRPLCVRTTSYPSMKTNASAAAGARTAAPSMRSSSKRAPLRRRLKRASEAFCTCCLTGERRVPRPDARESAKPHEEHTSATGAKGMKIWRASTRAISERSLSES